MSTEPFIGEVKIFGFYFAPRGYATCQGQILSIAQNSALFALIGTTYGGNGQTTFALPDLQGRMPMGWGQGPGLPANDLGQVAGSNSVTLLLPNLPMHTHTPENITVRVLSSTEPADSASPNHAFLTQMGSDTYASVASSGQQYGTPLHPTGNTSIAGSSMPMGITNPYTVMNYSIAIEGIFPSRN